MNVSVSTFLRVQRSQIFDVLAGPIWREGVYFDWDLLGAGPGERSRGIGGWIPFKKNGSS